MCRLNDLFYEFFIFNNVRKCKKKRNSIEFKQEVRRNCIIQRCIMFQCLKNTVYIFTLIHL